MEFLEGQKNGKSSDCIGSVYAKDITGPGYYYLSGSNPNPPYYDMWRKIHGARFTPQAIQWCRDNSQVDLKGKSDEDAWSLCKDLYFCAI